MKIKIYLFNSELSYYNSIVEWTLVLFSKMPTRMASSASMILIIIANILNAQLYSDPGYLMSLKFQHMIRFDI